MISKPGKMLGLVVLLFVVSGVWAGGSNSSYEGSHKEVALRMLADPNYFPRDPNGYPVFDTEFQLLCSLAIFEDDPDCQFEVARRLLGGNTIKQDVQKGVYWMEAAAKGGHAIAQSIVSGMYQEGVYVERDFQKCIYWAEKEAGQSDPINYFLIGMKFISDKNIHPDCKEAKKWFNIAKEKGYTSAESHFESVNMLEKDLSYGYQKAFDRVMAGAENGNAKSQYKLGIMYDLGIGIDFNPKEGIKWIRQSADQDYEPAQRFIMCSYMNEAFEFLYGTNVINQDECVAMIKTFAMKGDSSSQANLGLCYLKGKFVEKDYKKALYWSQKAARKGLAVAQNNIGLMYYHGYGVPINYEKAISYFEKAADQKYPGAFLALGTMYFKGQGVSVNYEKAFECYSRAAVLGDSYAKVMLGKIYYFGLNGEVNYKKAFNYFKQAARQPYCIEDARYFLGKMYERGIYVKCNPFLAIYWLKKPAENGSVKAQMLLASVLGRNNGFGRADNIEAYKWLYIASAVNKDAKKALNELEKELDREQLAEAVRRAEELAATSSQMKLPEGKEKNGFWKSLFE